MTTIVHILFFFSGAAVLGCQLVWARMFSAGLGHELPAVLAVVCAFMGGMSLGAGLLARFIGASEYPARWYAFLEITIGLWSALSAFLIPAANQFALGLIGSQPSAFRHWTIAFAMPLIVLLPSTLAMGGTFAAMERWLRGLQGKGVLSSVAAVYASNTAGAVAGTLASALVLMPALGFRHSALVFALVNLCCGIVAFLRGVRMAVPAFKPGRISTRIAITVFFTGLLGIGYEAAAIRVLSTVLENTIYTFAATLATFLFGTALGAAFYYRYFRKGSSERIASALLIWVAIACVAGIWPVALAQQLYDGFRGILGPSLLAECLVALLVLLPATTLMGMLFSHLVQGGTNAIDGVGRMLALNTLGAALAPPLIGLVAFPSLGGKWTMLAIALGYVALVPRWAGLKWSPLVFAGAALAALPANLSIVQIPPGGKMVDFRDGVMASVAVLEDAEGERTLRINNRFQQGGTAAANAEYRQAHMPLLLHPNPRAALFLGVGTGITLGAATLYDGLHAEGVELVPEVVDMIPHFDAANFSVLKSSLINVRVADARRYARAATNRYDVIVADLFHPAMDGAGLLYTTEHFRAIRDRLAADGLFCQWLPLYQLDEPLLRIIVKTFMAVFPEAEAWLLRFNADAPVLGLIGWMARPQYDAAWVERRLTDSNLERYVRQLTLSDSVRFFTHVLLDASTLRMFGESAAFNTDDLPHVMFGAPRVKHEGFQPYKTLMSLLQLPMPNPSSLFPAPASLELHARLAAAWEARHRYLRGLVAELEGREAEAVDAYVESARLSLDFTLGYARCATLASVRARSDPAFARQLLQRLVEAQPSQQLARDMLQRLSP